MKGSQSNTENKEDALSNRLVQYSDDFMAFNQDVAFLCDACSAIALNSEVLGAHSARGLERHAFRLKLRAEELTQDLEQIYALFSPHGPRAN